MELPPAEAAVLLVFRDEEDEVERAHDLPMLPPDTIALMLCTHVSNVGIQIIELYETIEPERRDALVDALEDRWNSEPREGRLTIRWPGTEESVVHEKILEPHS